MKIAFTGGGTGGHFYPIIAVAESVREIADKEKIVGLKLYYFSTEEYDKKSLFENGISFQYVSAGKMRIYSSVENFFDMFKTAFGTLGSIINLFFLYPDVIFSKGGYCSFPVVFAARILGIPVVVHESDSVPGRVNLWTGKFAERIAVSYPEAAEYFPENKTAVTGQPIREIIKNKKPEGAFEYLKLESKIPTILILGGSTGAEIINNAVIDALIPLVKDYQIIHQTGVNNFEAMKGESIFILEKSEFKNRYLPFAFLDPLALKMSAGAASIVISRAGSTIFEIASWGIPSIIIPITETNGDHQRKNAFSYARAGAATVIEENNLTTNVLLSEIRRFFEDKERTQKMADAAKAFSGGDAAQKIANVLLDIALSHEQ